MASIRRSVQRIALALGLALLASCTTINTPTVAQIVPDPPLFMVAHPLRFTPTNSASRIQVPAGFVTDLASIPPQLWWWQAPHGKTMAPAIVHDYLYWQQTCSKDEADAVFYVLLRELGMGHFEAKAIYIGVRTSEADESWEKNKHARGGGEVRFFTRQYADFLLEQDVKPGRSLQTIQREAAIRGGALTPLSADAEVKAACQASVREFERLGGA
ncbi:DUF1353 domain-containing protein [Massilia sp. ST3]|uniref:DUF1353 domain-containing protein n=1 Tax=Massilia sp. ST3 TaxID=2824903 RepID=UPI001B811D79|nr:DUF1353 domain-containing protein [Massilia sp. ST3]MBQ5946089.1 DUF1353 domain-containing protein [Massilia sp. ST3]